MEDVDLRGAGRVVRFLCGAGGRGGKLTTDGKLGEVVLGGEDASGGAGGGEIGSVEKGTRGSMIPVKIDEVSFICIYFGCSFYVLWLVNFFCVIYLLENMTVETS